MLFTYVVFKQRHQIVTKVNKKNGEIFKHFILELKRKTLDREEFHFPS